MTNYIQEQSDKLLQAYLKGEAKHFHEIENQRTLYDDKKLARDLEEMKTPGKANSWVTWKKMHRGRGIYASWKDDNMLKSFVKEFNRQRSLPFLLGGALFYVFMYNAFGVNETEHRKSGFVFFLAVFFATIFFVIRSIYLENWYPFGYPDGAKLNHFLEEVVEKDIGKAKDHIYPAYQK